MSAANRLSGVYNQHSTSTMHCGRCGATLPPGSDRCAVCHTRTVTAEDAATTGPGLQAYPDASETVPALTAEAGGHESATTAPGLHAPFPGLSHATVGPTVAGPAMGGAVLPPGQQFGPRYTIIRLLGSGGMASVYQAWDETLGTAVALKLIRVDATTPRAELRQLEDRFKRELKLARQVTHPNVVRIHDLGEVESTLYLTMEYVQGADLATLVQREPRLPLPRILLLARQIAAGLAAAHKAGIVHRDLKPANVMVDAQDHALLMDFGIARSTAGATINTMPGSLIGTLDYMAPEQARGEPTDERTDVYAFGLILYELLAGGRPRYSAEGGISGLIQRLEKGPPPLKSLQPDVPAALDHIVTKCLQPAAAARYASAADVLADLEALDEQGRSRIAPRLVPTWQRLAALLVLGAALIGATWWLARAGGGPPAPPVSRAAVPILIVDFENRAGESCVRRRAGAVAQHRHGRGARSSRPFRAATPQRWCASLKMGTQLNEKTGRLVASREGIPVILAGTIERNGSGYRVAVRTLAPDKAGAGVGGGGRRRPTRRRSSARWRALRRTCARRSATRRRRARSRRRPSPPGRSMRCAPTPMAQDLSTSQRDAEAAEKYREALRHDPEFGRAYSGLGASLFRMGNREEAEKNWNEALRRSDRMTEREKLRTFGGYYIAIARNTDKAIETYEQLVAKYPADSAGYNNLAIAYFNTLNFAKAPEYGRKAIDIYPRMLQIPIELRSVRDVRRRLQDRGGYRPGADQGRPQGRRALPAARDGSGRGRGYPAGAQHV